MPIDYKAIFADPQANLAALNGCDGPHEFVSTEPGRIGCNWRCTKCGGVVNAIDRHWYERGLAHGRAGG